MQHISLFVLGHSPAILTETLAISADTPCNEVRVCTTQTGKDCIKKQLFNMGGWQRFVQTYPVYANTCFDETMIIVPEGLDDIRSTSDQLHVSEAIFSMVRDAVQHADKISASIAGGRKTMGYLMGFAMSLFARPQDRLTHVLVPEAWERDRDFLFPSPEDANRITLVDVPFIRLGNHLKAALANADVTQLVASAQVALDMSALQPFTLHIRQRAFSYLDQTVTLPEREFSILQFFAQQKTKHCPYSNRSLCEECHDCFLSVDAMDDKKDELLAVRMQFGGLHDAMFERFEEAWKPRRAAATNLAEPLRRISEAIESCFGVDPRAEVIKIKNVGKRNQTAYGLMADKSQIRIKR